MTLPDPSASPAGGPTLAEPITPPPAPVFSGNYAPVTPWTPLRGVGAAILIMLIVVLVLAAGAAVIGISNPGTIERTGPVVRMHFDRPAVAYAFAAVMLASQLLGVALIFGFARMRRGRPRDVLALRPPLPGTSAYLWALPAFVVFGFAVGALVQWLSPQSSQADTQIMVELTRSPAWWLIFIAAVVMAPLQEELLFRGFLFSALARSRLGLIGTAILTSLGWAAIHGYSPQGNATIFALGLALSFILWRTGSTRVTMLCHSSYNALAFLAAAFAPPAGV